MSRAVVCIWAILAAAALPWSSLPALDPVAGLSFTLGAAGACVLPVAGEQRARGFFVLALGAILSPSGVLDVELYGGRVLWGLLATAFAWLGLQCMRPVLPLARVDRIRHRGLEAGAIGTLPATLAGLAEWWAIACAVLAVGSIIYDGRADLWMPLALIASAYAYAYTAPVSALTLAGFQGLVSIAALGLLWPYISPEGSHP